MPDTLSLSTGVSLGLIAGIVSSVCYLFANGYVKPKSECRDTFDQRCIAKEKQICVKCGGDQNGGFVPCICRHYQPRKFESGAWLLRQVQRALTLMPWSYSTDKLEQIDEEHEGSDTSDTLLDLRNVRDFLEGISSRLAGGTLEGTRVAPLYHHQTYLPQRIGLGPPEPTSSANSAHSQLKRIIARVVEEAAALPALAQYAAEPQPPSEDTTYEDLLATAILNKVIERYQTENGSGGRSSGIHSASASPSPSDSSSPRSLNSRNIRHTRDVTPPLHDPEDVLEWEDGDGEDTIELPRRVPFPEYGGDIVHAGENEYRDFDEVSGSDIQAADGSWEENWLFQKKKINTVQSVPVPMLVPNSNTEYKALIGDRDADDTTDLSDNGSDNEDEEIQYKSDIKKVLESKHVIGGKPKLDDVVEFEPDSLLTLNGDHEELLDSIENSIIEENIKNENVTATSKDEHDSILLVDVNSGPVHRAEFNLTEEIHRTMANGHHEDEMDEDHDITELCSLGTDIKCSESSFTFTNTTASNTLNHEREGEYEETVTVPVQRWADSLRRKHFDDAADDEPCRDLKEDLIPGSIAYRERQKWLNFVDMPNNPYSPEAINKRLAAKSMSALFDFSTNKRDYDDEPVSSDDYANVHSTPEPDSLDMLDDYKRGTHTSASVDCINHRSETPSPKMLKDGLSEEIPQYKRYGRDYYIKEAKSSSGGRKYISYSDISTVTGCMNKSTSLDNFDIELASPGLLIKQFNTIATNQEYTKFAVKENGISITTMPNEYKNEILIDYEEANEHALFSARPAYINEDTDRQFEEILQSAYSDFDKLQIAEIIDSIIDEAQRSALSIYENPSSYSSSSFDDAIKIYNVQTGEIVECEPDDKISSRYDGVDTKNDANSSDINDKTILGENVDKASEACSSDEGTLIVAELEDAIIVTELESAATEADKLDNINELDDIHTQLPNVKELAKKFTSMDNINETLKTSPINRRPKSRENIMDEKLGSKLTYMHSLTARSISKEFREELKLSMATPLTVPGGTKEIPEGTEDVTKESSRPGSPLPEPGTIKTKLAFFESLKSKFSNK